MTDKLSLDKAMKILEDSFLFWDEKKIKDFVQTVIKGWGIQKGGALMKTKELVNKGICSACIHDKDCNYPRKFPVHACDDFELKGIKKSEKMEKWDIRE